MANYKRKMNDNRAGSSRHPRLRVPYMRRVLDCGVNFRQNPRENHFIMRALENPKLTALASLLPKLHSTTQTCA